MITKAELLKKLRAEFPQYAHIADETLLAAYLKKYPQDVLDDSVSKTIAALKEDVGPWPLSIFDKKSAATESETLYHRKQTASHLVEIEKLQGEATASALSTATAKARAETILMAEHAEAVNRIVVAEEASKQKVPLADYAELTKERMRLEAAYAQKRLEMQLELEKERLSTRHVIELKLTNLDQQYKHHQRILEEIGQVHGELVAIREAEIHPEVKTKQLELREKKLRLLEAQYNERVEQAAVEATEE